jgi:hypothetical protein
VQWVAEGDGGADMKSWWYVALPTGEGVRVGWCSWMCSVIGTQAGTASRAGQGAKSIGQSREIREWRRSLGGVVAFHTCLCVGFVGQLVGRSDCSLVLECHLGANGQPQWKCAAYALEVGVGTALLAYGSTHCLKAPSGAIPSPWDRPTDQLTD